MEMKFPPGTWVGDTIGYLGVNGGIVVSARTSSWPGFDGGRPYYLYTVRLKDGSTRDEAECYLFSFEKEKSA